MGLFIQIIGILCVIASLIWSIIMIVTKNGNSIAIALLVLGILLINLGRKLH